MNTYIDLYNECVALADNSIMQFLQVPWEGKDKQESLFRMFAFLKLIPELNEFIICDGNFNTGSIVPNTDRSSLFKQSLKDKGDKSDISLMNDKTIIATTSKNLNKYGVNDLDIDSLFAIFNHVYANSNKVFRICIVVRDKSNLLRMANNAEHSSKRLVEAILKPDTLIYDWFDLDVWYHNFKRIYAGKSITDVLRCDKAPFVLRFHQEMSVIDTTRLVNDGHKDILWGHIPRSGKTFIMGGCIIASNFSNFLCISTAPTETTAQYIDMFTKYLQFEHFNIIVLNSSTTKKPKLGPKNIIICSKQYLQSKGVKADVSVKQIKWLRDLKIDMLFLDESHNGGTTDLTKSILKTYGTGVPTVYITATYIKPQCTYNIPKDAWITWDIEDIKLCQKYDLSTRPRLYEKHGQTILTLCEKYSATHICKEYEIFPDLHLLTWDFKADVKHDIIALTEYTKYGFSTDSIFLLKNSADGTVIPEFQNEDMVLKLCNTLFGEEKKSASGLFSIPKNQDNFLSRIEKICKNGNINSRWFTVYEPLTIMCFLPCGLQSCPIDLLQEALAAFLDKYNVLPDFEVVGINSKANGGKNAVDIINDARSVVKNKRKKGLLVLSGRQCSMAVSLSHCDIVLMMNNTESFDAFFQAMYRCMTEAKGKKCAFVVDLNLQRVVNVIIDYAIKVCPKTDIKTAVRYILEQRLISVNCDEWMSNLFGVTPIDINTVVSEIYRAYTSKPSNAIDSILKTLEIKLDILAKDQKMFNQLFHTTSTTSQIKELIDDLTKGTEIKKGIESVKCDNAASSSSGSTTKKKQDVNLIKDVMKHLIPLMCLLTIDNSDNNRSTFSTMCEEIQNTGYTKDILIAQLRVWWGSQITSAVDVIDLFHKLYNKYLADNDDFNIVVMRLKDMFNIAKGNPCELSKMIDQYLVPQEMEKKKNAEVSTPHVLRQDMLNSIPSVFWTTPKKVFEPCVGKGGFLLDIVSRFMTGLADEYPDETERYRVIVEECLYWSDINPVNVYICRLLLSPFGEHDLKYNLGDTLDLNIKEKWGIEGFDAVVGNPPYNDASGNKGKGHTLWTVFVEASLNKWLNENGYHCMVHPALWRQFDHKMFKLLKSKQLIYLEIHTEKEGAKIFKCNTRYDWYLLQNVPYNTATIILDEEGTTNIVDLREWSFLPNFGYSDIKQIVAKETDKKCEIMYGRSNYGSDKSHISKKQTTDYKYPVVYTMHMNGDNGLLWSSTNTNGHYGITKIIIRKATPILSVLSDTDGTFGLSEWVFGIAAPSSDHHSITEFIKGLKFQRIIKAISLRHELSIPILSTFKDKFWLQN